MDKLPKGIKSFNSNTRAESTKQIKTVTVIKSYLLYNITNSFYFQQCAWLYKEDEREKVTYIIQTHAKLSREKCKYIPVGVKVKDGTEKSNTIKTGY